MSNGVAPEGRVAGSAQKTNFGGGVDETADQPGARGPVDVDARAGCPLHVRAPAVSAAARCSTARRAASRCGQVKKSRRGSRRSRLTGDARLLVAGQGVRAAGYCPSSSQAQILCEGRRV
jgi:hypothetical protein